MKQKEYLQRISLEKTKIEHNLESLRILQKNHLFHIPFENLDIHWKRRIDLDINEFSEKIIEEKRGGFCYELNGLFNELLNELGFSTKIISARVNIGEKEFGAEYDHLAILTKVNEDEYLVDVGFGEFTADPLKFVLDEEQIDDNGSFLIRKFDEEYFEVVKKDENLWKSQYIFKDIAKEISEFSEMCEFHQTSPKSHFTQGKICSLMTENGRKTLTDKKFIETINGKRFETEVTSEEDFGIFLADKFGIKQKI